MPGAADDKDWEVVLAFYLEATSISGTNTIGEDTTELDVPFSTIIDKLEAAFSGHAELRQGSVGFIADVVIVKLGDQDVTLPNGLTGDFTFDMFILEALGSYRLGEVRSGAVDLFGGIRIRELALEFTFPGIPFTQGFDVTWMDPIIGARYMRQLHPRIGLVVRGDVGGFKLGSQYTWNVQGGIGISLTKWLGLLLEYKYLQVDYQEGEGDDFFEYDATEQGPLFAIAIRF